MQLLHCVFLRQGLTLNLELSDSARLPGLQTPDILYLCYPIIEVTGCAAMSSFCVGAKDQVLVFVWRAFY